MGAMSLLITGAGGFIGRHTVAAARARGHTVRALVRRESSVLPEWRDDPGITPVTLDLASVSTDTLAAALSGRDAVIHAAAAMSGDDARHARDTLAPTETLLAALAACGPAAPRLVLVSSIAVYDGRALPEGALLDEDAPLESRPEARDAYCRAKLAQERLGRVAAQTHGIGLSILRPGAVFGPGRLWNGHLGHPLGPVLIQLGTAGEVPVCHVGYCADALVLAAEAPRTGQIRTVNVIDEDRPDRAEYVSALRPGGWPRVIIPMPWRILAALGGLLERLGLGSHLPGLLRPAALHARLKPLRYSTVRLREMPGWRPGTGFAEAMARALADGKETR